MQTMPRTTIHMFDKKSGIIVFNTSTIIVTSSKQSPKDAKTIVNELENALIDKFNMAFSSVAYFELIRFFTDFLDTFGVTVTKDGRKVTCKETEFFMYGEEFCVLKAELIITNNS
jgi:hypothetical protein